MKASGAGRGVVGAAGEKKRRWVVYEQPGNVKRWISIGRWAYTWRVPIQ